ncbi:MAG: heavy-metal-associated domain-containing protein [Acidobacteria bacterium]|nr:heavy-metal-associated domain-containing protein [Acidobacteriota bacterium]
MALQRLDGVDHADVNLVKGEAQVFPKPGKSFDPVLIPKVIQDAGFTATEVVVTANGTLVKGGEFPELDVPGLNHPFVLAGGAQAATLRKRTDLVGKRIRVTGKLHPSHADRPPGLTVENFQAAP